VRVLALGWKPERVPAKGSQIGGIAKTYLKGLLILPFIPWVKNTFNRNPVTYLAGGLFHLGLFTVLILGHRAHAGLEEPDRFRLAHAAAPIVDWLAASAIVAMIALLINRLGQPVMKLLTGPAEWLNWLLCLRAHGSLAYVMTHHLFFVLRESVQHPYAVSGFAPDLDSLERISHFMFYFFSRTIHGSQFGNARCRHRRPEMKTQEAMNTFVKKPVAGGLANWKRAPAAASVPRPATSIRAPVTRSMPRCGSWSHCAGLTSNASPSAASSRPPSACRSQSMTRTSNTGARSSTTPVPCATNAPWSVRWASRWAR